MFDRYESVEWGCAAVNALSKHIKSFFKNRNRHFALYFKLTRVQSDYEDWSFGQLLDQNVLVRIGFFFRDNALKFNNNERNAVILLGTSRNVLEL